MPSVLLHMFLLQGCTGESDDESYVVVKFERNGRVMEDDGEIGR